MTKHQVRYFSKRTKAVRVKQLVAEVQNHPHSAELLCLLGEQVKDDSHRQGREVVYI